MLSGLYNDTQGQKEARRNGEFAKTNPFNQDLASIRMTAYEQGYRDAIEDVKNGHAPEDCHPFAFGLEK